MIAERIGVLSVLACLALTGCQTAQADPMEFRVGEPFVLGGSQAATIAGGGLSVRFTEVLEDSRCPTRVECFWTGQARIVIVAEPAGGPPKSVEFNTNPAPGLTVQTAQVGDYVITLDALDPYPQTPDDAPAIEDYRATLTVSAG